MALYAIGDLHLSFGTDKPMDVFGGGWVSYTDKIKEGFSSLNQDDVCVLCGDISWGISLEESLDDFRFIGNLPGKKIILKGNHDYWWTTAAKMKAFFEVNDIDGIEILHNNCYFYEGTAVCGTRGWMSDDEMGKEQNAKIMSREVSRLRMSLEAARDSINKLCFFHYPPRTTNLISDDLVSLMNEHDVAECIFGHLHGPGHKYAVSGMLDGIEYKMVSADFVGFIPQKIM